MADRRKRQLRKKRPARARLVAGAALVLFTALAAVALAASTRFVEPGTSPEATGVEPRSIAVADLDGDGDRDLAVANQGDDDVTILKNTGAGNFNQPSSSPEQVGDFPVAIVAADLDGDDDQDLAVANGGFGGGVTILKNTGAGNFNQPSSSPEQAGNNPTSLTAADLDGDGDQDLAVGNSGSNDVTILKNSGLGNFFEPGSSPEAASGGPSAVVAADLDGDGDQDLAVANVASPGLVTILKNTGAGNFNQPSSSPEQAGDGPRSIVAADLDGDGDQDLAVANGAGNDVTILKSTGSGNFVEAPSSPEPVGESARSLATADFEGDGDVDLAVANADDTVTILRNAGTGNFGEPGSSPVLVADTPTWVSAADLDGDADPDLAVARVNGQSVTILRNR